MTGLPSQNIDGDSEANGEWGEAVLVRVNGAHENGEHECHGEHSLTDDPLAWPNSLTEVVGTCPYGLVRGGG